MFDRVLNTPLNCVKRQVTNSSGVSYWLHIFAAYLEPSPIMLQLLQALNAAKNLGAPCWKQSKTRSTTAMDPRHLNVKE